MTPTLLPTTRPPTAPVSRLAVVACAVLLAGCVDPASPARQDIARVVVYDAVDGSGSVVGDMVVQWEGLDHGVNGALQSVTADRLQLRLDLQGLGAPVLDETILVDAANGRVFEAIRPCSDTTGPCDSNGIYWSLGAEDDRFPFGVPWVVSLPDGVSTLSLRHRGESFNVRVMVTTTPSGTHTARLLDDPHLPSLQPCSLFTGEIEFLRDGTLTRCTLGLGQDLRLRLRSGAWPSPSGPYGPSDAAPPLSLQSRQAPAFPDRADGANYYRIDQAIAAAVRNTDVQQFAAAHGPIDLWQGESPRAINHSTACTQSGCASQETSQIWSLAFAGTDGATLQVVVEGSEVFVTGRRVKHDEVVQNAGPGPSIAPIARPFSQALLSFADARSWTIEQGLTKVLTASVKGEVIGPEGDNTLRHLTLVSLDHPGSSVGWLVGWDAGSGLLEQATLPRADVERIRGRPLDA